MMPNTPSVSPRFHSSHAVSVNPPKRSGAFVSRAMIHNAAPMPADAAQP